MAEVDHFLTDLGNFCLWGTAIALAVWIGQYWAMEDWWRNAIGIRLVGLAACVIVIYIPSMLALAWPSQFSGFASTTWYHFLAVGIVVATFVFALIGNITWEHIRRSRRGRPREDVQPGPAEDREG